MKPYHIILSCEHGGNMIPKAYKYLFFGNEDVLDSHRGYDLGALKIAKNLSDGLRLKLFAHEVSRLLVDCNRSRNNKEIFSEFTNSLDSSVREYLIQHYYTPYRQRVEKYLEEHIVEKPILHLSIHTFTPKWNGVYRLVDIGFLYDENRYREEEFSREWQAALHEYLPDLNINLNEPYSGSSDGFTTYLRSRFPKEKYLGIEVEVNQKWVTSKEITHIAEKLEVSLLYVLNEMASWDSATTPR